MFVKFSKEEEKPSENESRNTVSRRNSSFNKSYRTLDKLTLYA